MERIFKGMIADFDSVSISMAHEMDIRISDMIIHEMLPQAWMIILFYCYEILYHLKLSPSKKAKIEI